ncbi:MAG TPA: vWA domain-containing protein, partial [Polyangiaceae bacterium]|nr:vWA domain-containing protein [Polyangiaceae bacterium]
MTNPEHARLLAAWSAAWPRALEAWSAYTLLREPRFFESNEAAQSDGMAGEFAAIRLRDHSVMVNVAEVLKRGLEPHALPILAHEIGHHVYVPGNLTDNARMLAAIARMLTGLPKGSVHLVANLYGDLLINDRLHHRADIDVASVYVQLKQSAGERAPNQVWSVYTRTYEHLWRLKAGTLAPERVGYEMDADAMLLARLVRSFAGDWLRGARRVATVLYRYLAQDELDNAGKTFVELGLHDTGRAGAAAPGEGEADAAPDGLAAVDASEIGDDDEFEDELADPLGKGRQSAVPEAPNTAPGKEGQGHSGTQYRTPFEYGELLRTLGLNLDAHEITTRYYRERALPHLIPFPVRRAPQATEPLAEGYEEWNPGEALEALDLFGSILRSPRVIPGVTTVQRTYADVPGNDPAKVPMDLDIYVDCSGSMPNPAFDVSYLSLCAAILALSALRAGARVQATLWSSAGTFETTGGFLRDERRVLGTVTGYVSGGTAFPLHLLRDTYQERKASEPPAHIVVISDDGCDTMLAKDEFGNDGASVAATALAR